MGNLTWDYDLKRDLLGDNYDEERPIINILRAKKNENYQNKRTDYHIVKIGHVENLKKVEAVFKTITEKSNHKDIMNSFWTTYKCFLQVEYPEIFMPDGSIKGDEPLKIPPQKENENESESGVSMSYSPFDSEVHEKYIAYYKREYPNLIVKKGDLWVDFLEENYEKFPQVHNNEALNTFAKLTHTIGNIAVVPKGFNAGRNNGDYWDLALVELKNFLEPFQAWESYITFYSLEKYLDNKKEVIPFWENHLEQTTVYPFKRKYIIEFLEMVNKNIEERGRKLCKEKPTNH